LVLEGVFTIPCTLHFHFSVSTARDLDCRAQFDELGGKVFVHGDVAEGRLISLSVINGGEGKRFVMRGSNHYDAVVLPVFKLYIRVSCHAAGELVARMRTNQGHQVTFQFLRRRQRQKSVDHFSQFVRVCGVETPCHIGRPDLMLLAQAEILRLEHKQYDGDKQGK